MRLIADNLWVLEYPLKVLGENHGRVVTVMPGKALCVPEMTIWSSAETPPWTMRRPSTTLWLAGFSV